MVSNMSYLDGSLGYALSLAQLSVLEGAMDAFADHQITMIEFLVLMLVADNAGISQADVGEALDTERPRIVPTLNRLEKRGFVEQTELASEERFRQIHLTPSGRQFVRVLRKRAQEHRRKVMARLDATEAKMILSSLWKLAGKEPATKKRTGGIASGRAPAIRSKKPAGKSMPDEYHRRSQNSRSPKLPRDG